MSKQFNYIELLSNALQIGRTSQFIGILGITVWSIWSTALMKRSIANRYGLVVFVWSPMERSDEATCLRIIKRLENTSVRSWSDASNAFWSRLILTVITPCDQRSTLKRLVNSDSSHVCPSILSKDQRSKSHARSDVPHVVTSPPHRDRWSWLIGRLWLRHVTCAL